MHRVFVILLTAMAVVVLPGILAAQEAGRPQSRPGPGMMFQRLDANKDGQVTADEVPKSAPEHVKAFLKRADANGDKKLTPAELRAAAMKMRTAMQQRRPGSPQASRSPQRRPGPPQASRSPQRRPGPPQAGPRPGLPDPKIVFAHMDRNHDKALSLEEFTEGVKRFHQRMGSQGHRPGPPQAQRSGPPQARKPGPPQFHRPGPPQAHKSGPPQGHKPGPPQCHKPGPPQGHKPGASSCPPKKPGPKKPAVKKDGPKGPPSHGDMAKHGEEMRKRIMAKFDKNKDGKIDDAEKKAIHDEMVKRHQAHKAAPKKPEAKK